MNLVFKPKAYWAVYRVDRFLRGWHKQLIRRLEKNPDCGSDSESLRQAAARPRPSARLIDDPAATQEQRTI